ncbi:MAG: zinc ribbon domain-containing protein, partial [Methanobacteriaceae archaeon]|nr:zinc ribbon domain-containing protein [Methanobacteriaceae archaeon]
MENHWDRTCLIQNKTIMKNILLNNNTIKPKSKASTRYCPNCGNKIKNHEVVCPICGIHLNE